MHAYHPNGLGDLVPLGVHVAKAMHGGSFPTDWARAPGSGLRTAPSAVLSSAAEAKHCQMVGLAPGIKTALYMGIVLSPACGDAE